MDIEELLFGSYYMSKPDKKGNISKFAGYTSGQHNVFTDRMYIIKELVMAMGFYSVNDLLAERGSIAMPDNTSVSRSGSIYKEHSAVKLYQVFEIKNEMIFFLNRELCKIYDIKIALQKSIKQTEDRMKSFEF
jgi:hypothetical protein